MLLRLYKIINASLKFVSAGFLPSLSCRFVPSCSEYAIAAVKKFGLVRGGYLATHRLMRCHPFSKGGYDPIKN